MVISARACDINSITVLLYTCTLIIFILRLLMLLTGTSQVYPTLYSSYGHIVTYVVHVHVSITSNLKSCCNLRQIQRFQRQSNVFIHTRRQASWREMENDVNVTNVYKRSRRTCSSLMGTGHRLKSRSI